ncbi:MAG: hypothetical protein ABJB11_13695 [Ferruginibacter sp.]
MKYFLMLLFFIPGRSFSQTSLFDIQLKSLDGKIVRMKDYKGKKIVISTASAVILQSYQLAFLDSLQESNPSIVVIAVPAIDFGGIDDSLKIGALKKSSRPNMVVAAADWVKKSNGIKQNRLLQWLTNSSQNTHFNADITMDAQLYIISESGVLYAVLEKGTPVSLINQLLKQEDVKQ